MLCVPCNLTSGSHRSLGEACFVSSQASKLY